MYLYFITNLINLSISGINCDRLEKKAVTATDVLIAIIITSPYPSIKDSI